MRSTLSPKQLEELKKQEALWEKEKIHHREFCDCGAVVFNFHTKDYINELPELNNFYGACIVCGNKYNYKKEKKENTFLRTITNFFGKKLTQKPIFYKENKKER